MARHRQIAGPATTAVRLALADNLRQLIADYGESAVEAGFSACHWFARLEALESGEPVVVPVWEVLRHLPGDRYRAGDSGHAGGVSRVRNLYPFGSGDRRPAADEWVRVEADGSLTPMVLIHRADGVVDWVPVA